MKDFSALRHCQAKKVKVMNSGKLRHGSEVTFLENVGGGGVVYLLRLWSQRHKLLVDKYIY